jgi:hypothetical protein
MQGAFTLWNLQPDPKVVIEAELLDIAAGTARQPVRRSGVFVGGHGNPQGKADGGQLVVTRRWGRERRAGRWLPKLTNPIPLGPCDATGASAVQLSDAVHVRGEVRGLGAVAITAADGKGVVQL